MMTAWNRRSDDKLIHPAVLNIYNTRMKIALEMTSAFFRLCHYELSVRKMAFKITLGVLSLVGTSRE